MTAMDSKLSTALEADNDPHVLACAACLKGHAPALCTALPMPAIGRCALCGATTSLAGMVRPSRH